MIPFILWDLSKQHPIKTNEELPSPHQISRALLWRVVMTPAKGDCIELKF